jgi:tRNA threonylcarbamoyladenosine biosynthesis protein TsaE
MTAQQPDPVFYRARPEHAAGMVEVIHAAFGARPPLDPPSTAGSETPDSVAAAVAAGSGVYAEVDGRPAGAIIIAPGEDRTAVLRRVSVHPDFQRHGIASAMVTECKLLAAELGCVRVELLARIEFGELIDYWRHRGFAVAREVPHGVILGRGVPRRFVVPRAADMQRLGALIGARLRAGDLIIASGDLGAGKTTLTQGIGRGMETTGAIISPTFVLSRIHRGPGHRPDLVHVDAYRLSDADELEDLDLWESFDRSATVVEWGEGIAEGLSDQRLEISVLRSPDATDDTRIVLIDGIGDRWGETDLDQLVAQMTATDRERLVASGVAADG